MVVLMSLASTAQTTQTNGSLSGVVVNQVTQSPIPGVSISVVGTKLGAISNKDGKFTIKGISPGIISVKISSIGYEGRIISDIPINSAKAYQLNIELREVVLSTEEVQVSADYFSASGETATSNHVLSAEEVRRAPGVQEDVIRSVALLPGVGVTAAGRNDLVVRGGAPFENLFVVDNIEVPNINHFGSQGSSGGPLTLVNIGFVRGVQFSAGGFGAQYGNRVSSYTNISLREGNEDHFSGEGNFSATGFGLILEGPVGDDATVLFNVRRSFLDILFKALKLSFIPDYWDMTIKANWKLDSKNSLSFLTLGALDKISVNSETVEEKYKNSSLTFTDQNQYFSGLTWKHLFDNGYFTATLGRTYSVFNSRQNDSLLNPLFSNSSTEGVNSFNINADIQLSPTSDIRFGSITSFASKLHYDVFVMGPLRRDQSGAEQPLQLDTTFQTLSTGAYVSYTTQLPGEINTTVGARGDYYTFIKDGLVFSPRLSLTKKLGEKTSVDLNMGRYYQPPSYVWLIGDDANTDNLKPIRADQVVLGLEQLLTEDLRIQVQGFYKWYANYPARVYRPQAVLSPSGFEDITTDIPFGLEPLIGSGNGIARGAEIFLQKRMGKIPLYGLMSLTIQQSRFTGLDGIERPGSFDSRYIFNLAAGYRIAGEWELSAKFRLAQGQPTTPFITQGPLTGTPDFSQYNNGDRLPTFHALDMRIDKRWAFSSWQLVTYFDVQNVYGRRNVSNIRWDRRAGKVADPNATNGSNTIPSAGINVIF